MLTREPVLLVTLFHTVWRISPLMTPHRISLVVGTSTLRRSFSTWVVPSEPSPSESPAVAGVLVEGRLAAMFRISSSTPYFHRSPVTSLRISRSISPLSLSV